MLYLIMIDSQTLTLIAANRRLTDMLDMIGQFERKQVSRQRA